MHLGFTNRQQKSPEVGAFDICGGEGIRTLDTLSDIHTFQACQFNHSCTPPFRLKVAKIINFQEITKSTPLNISVTHQNPILIPEVTLNVLG